MPVRQHIRTATATSLSLVFLLSAPHTARSQVSAEPPRGAPGPTTVITDAMIANIGARHLKDVLVTYVPGITFSQDHNEVVVAMRGIYGSSQQQILILVNGHVLNSRSLAEANLDPGISLDKIKRIEVVRGPASSLYGSGALAAVVNIFTKTAEDVGGDAMISGGAGGFGTVSLSGLYGGRTTGGADVLAWGSLYKSDGQVVDIPARQDISRTPRNAHAILDGFNGPPTHDVGLNVKTPNFTLYAAHRLGRYVEPFSGGGSTGESYNYADYQYGDGVGPGLAMSSFNLDLSHERTLAQGATLRVRGYFDKTEHLAHLVVDPSQKAHSLVSFSDWGTGLVADLGRSYAMRGHEGRWSAGAQVEVMRLYDSVLASGTGGGWTTTGPTGGLLDLGEEKNYSGVVQVKQSLGAKWTANASARYDLKVHHDGDNINTVSPGASLVYVPSARANVTVSYAEGFLDAPYFYRYNSLASYRGARTLQPEHLRSFQVTPAAVFGTNLNARLNVFVNDLDNLVWRNTNAGPAEPTYQNAGFLKSWGVEPEVGYTKDAFNVTGHLTYQRATSAQHYGVIGNQVQNVPTWAWNAIANVRPFIQAKNVWLNVTVRYIGAQLSPVNITIGTTSVVQPSRTVDSALVVNAGTRIVKLWSSPWFVDARVYNLFDVEYEQGGSVPHPYPQAGRSALVRVGRTL